MFSTLLLLYLVTFVISQGKAPDFSGSGPWPASLLGDVGFTDVVGRVTEGVATPIDLPIGENIFGPFENGFGENQADILRNLGCDDPSQGYVTGGIDTYLADEIISFGCNITLPRIEDGIRISLLDTCGGHTRQYHFHQRLRCLYEDEGTHSTKVGHGLDGKYLYGKWEDFEKQELPHLDACGGHWGMTPESPSQKTYHYHVQDHAPFTIGCYGPNPDNSPVTVEQCRKIYNKNRGCDDNILTISTRDQQNFQYDDWCPCYDKDGSNVGTVPLSIFSTPDATGPGADYIDPMVENTDTNTTGSHSPTRSPITSSPTTPGPNYGSTGPNDGSTAPNESNVAIRTTERCYMIGFIFVLLISLS